MNRLLMMAMVVAIGLTACIRKEHVDWGTDTGEDVAVGYLSFGQNGVSVVVDSEESENQPDTQSSTGKPMVTRASSLNDYTVQIFNSEGDKVKEFTYGDWTKDEAYKSEGYTNDGKHPALTYGGIELPVGDYAIRVFSAETQNVSDAPQYEGHTTVKLKKGIATVANVTCTLSSVKVTVSFDANMAEVIDPARTFVLARLDEESIEENNRSAYTFNGYASKNDLMKSHDEITPIYLKPQSPSYNSNGEPMGSPLNLYLTTLYGVSYNNGEITGGSSIDGQKLIVGNVKAGEWRKVTIKLDHGSDGTVYFVVNVETWSYNEQIDVTQSVYAANLAESEIPDVTDAPTFETPEGGLDFTQPLTLTADMFSESGVYNGNAQITVKTKQPIKAIYLSATSDSEGLPELISAMGLNAAVSENNPYGGLNLAGTLSATNKTLLGIWGFPVANILGSQNVAFNIAGLLEQLQSETTYTGNHTFSLTVVDQKNNNSTATLSITSGIIITDIVWVEMDINKRYDIYTQGDDPTTMALKVTAASGIKSLIVTIEGPLSDKNEKTGKSLLDEVGIPASFDLVNPGQNLIGGELADNLEGLGFPVGDKVKGLQSISFDITTFKTMLKVAPGDTNFKLTLTENDPDAPVVEKSMMINVINEPYPGK